jgi:anaerobic selenocysteine-containing dehydrogenase
MKRYSACTFDCPDACTLILEPKEGGGLRLVGDPASPFTRGVICAKTRRHLRRLASPERIRTPLRRTAAGAFQPLGWEAALELCAEKIQRLRADPTAILHIHSDGAKGILKEAVALFFSQLGTSRIRGSLCDAAGFIASVEDFGSRENNDLEDLENARAIVNWGRDLRRSSIHAAAAVHRARRRGARVTTISPGGDVGRPYSETLIRIRPGTDRFLAAALIGRLLAERPPAAERLARARSAEAFFELVSRHAPAELLAACEVSAEDAARLFRTYTGEGPVATLIGAGLQRYRYGGENVRFIDALAFLCGHVGVPGGGVYFHLHSFRNFDLAFTKGPGHKGRRAFQIAAIGREIAAADPPVAMVWVNGINVVNQAPGALETARAFEAVPFKVVVDAFMNDTAARADLILPCTLMLEQADVIGSFQHEYVQYAEALVPPPEGARPDYWIVSEIGRRLDPPVDMPAPEACLRAALASPWLDVSLEELKRRRFVRSKRPAVAYAGGRFAHEDGRVRFPAQLHPEPPPPAGFPLRLLTLVRRGAIHSQILPEDQGAPPTAWVAPECPALGRLDRAQPARLVSPHGDLAVRVRTMPGLHPGAVVVRRGGWMRLGGGVNRLTAAGLTDLGGGAPFYEQYVRLENG